MKYVGYINVSFVNVWQEVIRTAMVIAAYCTKYYKCICT